MDQIETSTTSTSGYQEPGLWQFIQITVFSLLGLLIIIFNLFLLVMLKRGKDIFDDVTVLLFRSLATTDIVTGVLVAILEGIVFYFRDFPYSHTACLYMPFVCCCMVMSASIHVCLMNLQRFIAVSYPFQYLRIANVKHMHSTLAIVKIVIVCISLVLLPVHNFPMTSLFQSMCESRSFFYMIDDIGALSTSATASIIVIMVMIVVPVVVLTFTNVRLLIIANRKRRGRPDKHGNQLRKNNGVGNVQGPQCRCARLPKGLKTVFIITFLFYLSVTPFIFALGTLFFQPPWREAGYDAIFFVSVLTILSSCWWNVPVYVLTNVTFRRRALSMLRRVCHLRRRDVSSAIPTSTDTYNEPSKQTVTS